MHYVKEFHINGVATKQVACIELHGKPNAATEGAVGVLGVDMDSPLHEVYKCVGVNGSIYSWELLSSGLSIMSATITGGGTESVQFLYANLLTPAMYVVKIGDLILDSEGYLYQIKALNTIYCDAKYTGTQVAAYGFSAYDLAVKNGFEGDENEWLASLKGDQGIQGIQGIQGEPGYTPYIGENGTWWIAGIDTGVNADKGTQMESGWYNGVNQSDTGGTSCPIVFPFAPKAVFIRQCGVAFTAYYENPGYYWTSKFAVLFPDLNVGVYLDHSNAIGASGNSGNATISMISTVNKSEDGKTINMPFANVLYTSLSSKVLATEDSGYGNYYVALG